MRSGTIAALAGVLLLTSLPDLPDIAIAECLPIALSLVCFSPRLRVCAFFATGFLWAVVQAHAYLSNRLPELTEGRELIALGWVVSVPERSQNSLRFEFQID